MNKDEFQFYVDNYCPKEIFKRGNDFKTCGAMIHSIDNVCCYKCWENTLVQKGDKVED